MKKLLLLIFVIIPFLTSAQQSDSTQIKLSQIRQALIFMRSNLEESHAQFKIGCYISLSGAAITTLGTAWKADPAKTNYEGAKSFKNITTIFGAVLLLSGTIYIIYSHSFIGRAGKWQFTPTSISYDF
jgi:hypothetical protein